MHTLLLISLCKLDEVRAVLSRWRHGHSRGQRHGSRKARCYIGALAQRSERGSNDLFSSPPRVPVPCKPKINWSSHTTCGLYDAQFLVSSPSKWLDSFFQLALIGK